MKRQSSVSVDRELVFGEWMDGWMNELVMEWKIFWLPCSDDLEEFERALWYLDKLFKSPAEEPW